MAKVMWSEMKSQVMSWQVAGGGEGYVAGSFTPGLLTPSQGQTMAHSVGGTFTSLSGGLQAPSPGFERLRVLPRGSDRAAPHIFICHKNKGQRVALRTGGRGK